MDWATNSSPPPVLSYSDPFPGGQLPGPGPDAGSPIAFHDYASFDTIHENSNLDFLEIRTSIGTNYRFSENVGFYGQLSIKRGWTLRRKRFRNGKPLFPAD